MIAVVLFALFAATAVASGFVIADSAARGRNAFRQLRGDLARLDREQRITRIVEEGVLRRPMPALRRPAMATPARSSRRSVRSPVPTLHAAA